MQFPSKISENVRPSQLPYYSQTFETNSGLLIDEIIQKEFIPYFKAIPNNVLEICEFGITALLNNVVDHAKAKHFTIKLLIADKTIKISIMDDGIGIFRNVSEKLNLDNRHLSALELAKGKMTTDPDNHSGDDLSIVRINNSTDRINHHQRAHSKALSKIN